MRELYGIVGAEPAPGLLHVKVPPMRVLRARLRRRACARISRWPAASAFKRLAMRLPLGEAGRVEDSARPSRAAVRPRAKMSASCAVQRIGEMAGRQGRAARLGSARSRRRRSASDVAPARRPPAGRAPRRRCAAAVSGCRHWRSARCGAPAPGCRSASASSADVGLRIEAGIVRQASGSPRPRAASTKRRIAGSAKAADDGRLAGQQAEIGDRRMRAVEQPQLHLLERR